MFRRAVTTIEGSVRYHRFLHNSVLKSLKRVKADALFSYQPPLNLFAFLIMFPASYVLTPRWFHKVCSPVTLDMPYLYDDFALKLNVMMIR